MSDVERVVYRLATEIFRDYPDPMPAFSYLGGDAGRGLLESALAQPRVSWEGRFLHRTTTDKAGALMRSMIKNHPFEDGNKRMGLAATQVFLLLNGRVLVAPPPVSVAFALELSATKGAMPLSNVTQWIRRRSLPQASFATWIDDIDRSGPDAAWQIAVAEEISRPIESVLTALWGERV